MIYQDTEALQKGLADTLAVAGGQVEIMDDNGLRERGIDALIYTAVFSDAAAVRTAAQWLIRRAGAAAGIHSASIQSLYEAMGRREVQGFTVPAINIRALTYHTAQAVLRAAMKLAVGPVIFEIARSEIDYTRQRPAEYIAAVTAAAIKVGYRGPLFLQGDHFQVNAGKYAKNPDQEVKAVKDLIWEAIEAGFYNIDVDTSTLVDLTRETVREQQRINYTLAAELTAMIRDLEPAGITVSVGGEIGEVGGKNSTVEELDAFMAGYREELRRIDPTLKGISKISVQTGTTHGGVPMPDGTVAKVKLDFETLEKLSAAARETYGLAGAVQHGASTLPPEAFDRFPAVGTAEVHLATGFQNLIYESAHLPAALKSRVYEHLRTTCQAERKTGETEEQFLYKTRKKGFGPFKKDFWSLPPETLAALGRELEDQFSFLFDKLNLKDTRRFLEAFITPVDVPLPAPRELPA
ncbi:MAG TPA: class II fructose-bisphosphate aldolase [Syntrophales bacterium]|nr:class II fructose-bisphosphate aldolase [Syntrophales bacterium]HON22644.1 class II fructose-bisphosphate aldolase [Syntrophales bacterium]HOU78041.1 class II fructose-bisphosphate aldolase [Syntrophales bacterium]HPC33034.1 class II fructose-bisphosphate aldolase [Syntrophales bacterium]HQG34346.1 class II fructose-bisphosphate aldolase [Syntrophales bacterium]